VTQEALTNKELAVVVRRALLMVVRALEKKYKIETRCPHCRQDYTEKPLPLHHLVTKDDWVEANKDPHESPGQ
jgi:hypothetical protein